MHEAYPNELEIMPAASGVAVEVTVPGSKSITNRALVLAALAKAPKGCRLHGAFAAKTQR